MDPEIKKALEDQGKAWNEFQAASRQRDEEIKKHGTAIAGTEEKLAKLNEALDAAQKTLSAVELAMKRGDLGGTKEQKRGRTEAEQKHYDAFIRYARTAKDDGLEALREEKAMTANSQADGGYLVPPDISGRIITKLFETSPMRQYANVVTTTSDALEGIIDIDEVDFEWVGETNAPASNKTPQFGKYRVAVYEGATRPRISSRLLEDASQDVEALLMRKIADKIARGTNAAYVNGDGVAKPKGYLQYANANNGIGKIEFVKSGHASLITDTGLLNLVYSLKAAYRNGAVFAMNRMTQASVRGLKDSYGQFVWQPGLQLGQPGSLLGFPVAEFNDMPTVAANAYPIAFGNFYEGYQIVDRAGMSVLRDPYTAKPYVEFFTRFRTGGDVVNFEAIKLQKIAA